MDPGNEVVMARTSRDKFENGCKQIERGNFVGDFFEKYGAKCASDVASCHHS